MIYFFLLCLCCCVEATDSPLRIGMELSYPPFEIISTKGEPCGISADIAKAIGAHLHRPMKIQNIAYLGLLPALNTDKIDLIISSLTITEPRKKAVDFSIPYMETGLCLLLSNTSTLQNISQVNKPSCVVVVKSGTSGEIYAKQHLNKATVRVLDREAMCVLEVVQGKADAFIYDQLAVYTHWKKNPLTTRAALAAFQKERWGIAVKKDRPELLHQLNEFIESYRASGGFKKLADKYLSEIQANFREQGVLFIL